MLWGDEPGLEEGFGLVTIWRDHRLSPGLDHGARGRVSPQFTWEERVYSEGSNGRKCLREMTMKGFVRGAVGALAAGAACLGGTLHAQAPADVPKADSSLIAPDGTAYVTRIVPVPATVSPEAQRLLAQPASDAAGAASTVQQDRAGVDRWQTGAGEVSKRLYPAEVATATVAGVPVRIVTPAAGAPMVRDCVLMNLHGGGFRVDSGSLTETIPMANLTGMKVVSVLYRMAPEHPFPAAVDDAVAVYKELLKTYKPGHIAIYGTSAGAILTAEVTVKLRELGLPLPGATGIFSGSGDMSQPGDSMSLFSLSGLSGHLDPPVKGTVSLLTEYVGSTDPRNPVLSPLYADLKGFPPTLFISSERDLLLSGTTILHRAYLRAGVDAELVVFDGLPHAFWNNPELPESKEADGMMARFLEKHVGR
jgi:monoterpene epsilon-lactone hydrolase